MCCLCKRERESIDHLLIIHCNVASSFWGHFLKASGMVWCNPSPLVDLIEARRGVSFRRCMLILWRIIPFSIMWSTWKERNEIAFRGKKPFWKDIITTISLRIVYWPLVRKESSNFT